LQAKNVRGKDGVTIQNVNGLLKDNAMTSLLDIDENAGQTPFERIRQVDENVKSFV
jgi:hypothetical protein